MLAVLASQVSSGRFFVVTGMSFVESVAPTRVCKTKSLRQQADLRYA